MTAPTPAVERGGMAGALAYTAALTDATHPHVWRYVSRSVITAALTDPDDPASLARTLFQIHLASDPNLIPGEESLELWPLMSEGSRVHWRAVADGLRMMLTGSGS